MKKIKISFLLLVGWIGLHGQGYLPLLDTNKVWNIFEDWMWWGETHPYYLERCESDTTRFIIKKEWQFQQTEELGYLFEDTVSQKVYYSDLYDNVVLLYDFSLSEGDVFYSNSVTKVDSVELLDGTYRKRIVFEGGDYYLFWIEGIGSLMGGLLWIDWDFMKHIPEAWLLCYYENDSLLYRNDFLNFACDFSYSNVNTETLDNTYIPKIYPNPFTQKISISFKNLLQGETFELEIKTLKGRTVYSKIISSATIIDLSFLDKGIYLLTLKNKHLQFTEKIIKL